MGRWRPGAALFALAVGACATPGLIYSSERSGAGDLYAAKADGSDPRLVIGHPLPDHFPRCSPNGRQVAFVRGRGAEADIMVADRRTGVTTKLTDDNVADSTPAWSSDGRWIYFTRRDGRFDRIARMEASGGPIAYLTDGTAHDTMPSLSPSGRRLVHHSYRYGRETELHLVDLSRASTRRLTTASGFDYEAAFAGEDIVLFSSDRHGGHYRLYRLDIADGRTRLLADTGADAWGPRFTRKTGQVLFYSGSNNRFRLMSVPLAGGPVSPIPGDGDSNSGGDWCRN